MTDKLFFSIYIPALEKAIANDTKNYGYSVYTPDWYIDDPDLRNEVDLFEQKNYEKYRLLFEPVALYFDARSHYFTEVDGVEIKLYRAKLVDIIYHYKKQYNL